MDTRFKSWFTKGPSFWRIDGANAKHARPAAGTTSQSGSFYTANRYTTAKPASSARATCRGGGVTKVTIDAV